MLYTEIVDKVTRLIESERLYYPDETNSNYRWYLGFAVLKTLREHNNLYVNPKYIDTCIAPTLCGISIIIDYEKPDVIKLFKECKGV